MYVNNTAVLSAVVVLCLSACDQGPERSSPPAQDVVATRDSSRTERPRLVPEWDSVTAVVVGVSQAFDSMAFASTSGAGARALLDERLAFYRSIASVSSEVELIMFVDRPEHAARARSAMGNAENLSVIARPSWVWMRDFVPLSAEAGGRRVLVGYTSFMQGVSQSIADHVSMPLVMGAGEIAPSIEGGNILVDGEGRCYVSVHTINGDLRPESAAEVRDLADMCTEVRTVPRMSYELTGHIDMFARLMNDTTVLVAEYSGEGFHVAAEPVERIATCTDVQIRDRLWNECDSVRVVYPDMGHLLRGPSDFSPASPLTVPISEVPAVVRDLHRGEEIDFVAPVQLDRDEHLSEVADAFADYGFRVVRVENPNPYVSLERIVYQDAEGSPVKRVMRLQAIFPTYTNALMVNGVIYLPQYATASAEQNEQARSVYEIAGFTVVPIDMTQSIGLRGATRCLAAGIHGSR